MLNPDNYAYDRKTEHLTVIEYDDNRVPPPAVSTLVTRERGYLSKPDLVRRVKPADLFRFTTPYKVQSRRIHFADGRKVTPIDSTARQVQTGPISYWVSEIEAPFEYGFTQSDFGLLDQKLRNRIKDQKVDLLTACAELRQTTTLVTGLAEDIVQTFSNLCNEALHGPRRLGRDAVRRALANPRTRYERQLANRWLSYSFGLKPTMEDIYGLAEASVVRFNEGVQTEVKTHRRFTRHYQQQIGLVTAFHAVDTLMRVKARYAVRSNEQMKLAQLGITNPLAFLWEVTPWSFAVDWVLDIGSFLESLDALVGCYDIVVNRSGGMDILYQQKVAGIETVADFPITGYHKIRQRLAPSDDLSMGYPKVKGIFDTTNLGTRLANMSALLTQIVSPRKG